MTRNEIETSLRSQEEHGIFVTVLDYDDFSVVYDLSEHKYYYLDTWIEGDSEAIELEAIACLNYDVNHDLKLSPTSAGEILSGLFDCDICGERTEDGGIFYVWFKFKN